MKRILFSLLVFVVTTFSVPSFGRCPGIEGHFTPDGERNKDSYIDVNKKDCETFEVTKELGELTFTIKLGGGEKCEDSLFRKTCYSGTIFGANEVKLNFKESWKADGCIRDEILKIDEVKKTIETDIKVNCGKKGITTYPKVIFKKVKAGN